MYQFNIDKSSDQYKIGFNQIWNDAHVFTPKDTAIVTPNSDTPYSMLQPICELSRLWFVCPKLKRSDTIRYSSATCTPALMATSAAGPPVTAQAAIWQQV
jgi:hypothetical protein